MERLSTCSKEGSELPSITHSSPPIDRSSDSAASPRATSTLHKSGRRSPEPGSKPISGEIERAAQAQEGSEATEQAETNITVDSKGSLEMPFNDDGYGSDSLRTATTTFGSSVQGYVYENDRRYHRFREGLYNFPNDASEQDREDMKHAMMVTLCQVLFFAPIGPKPQNIMDIGTGTGIWSIDMGDRFPSASILGVDLSPIQPGWVPPNVRFIVDDVESPWLHPHDSFDYIHSRHMVMAIRDWHMLMDNAFTHLKPGGWMELQEIHHFPQCHDGTMPPDHPTVRYWDLVSKGLEHLGINFNGVLGLADKMRNAGFVNVTERVFHIPIGLWPKNKVLKMVGLYWRTILSDGASPIALGPLTRGLKWTREEVEMFLVDVRKAYLDTVCHSHMPLHIIYGQKPSEGH